MKVLFIGNSYTYYNEMPKIVEALAAGNGKELTAHQVTKGGWYLHKYLDEKNEYQDKLMALIEENKYDVCFLQEQSMCPYLDYDRFADGAKRLMKLMENVTGEFVLYQTWARKEGSPSLEKHGLTPEQFGEGIVAAYEKLGNELGLRVSPVGRAFAEMRKVSPDTELYNEDNTWREDAVLRATEDVLRRRLRHGEEYLSTTQLTLLLRYENRRWVIVPDEMLYGVLAGEVGK